MSVIGPVLLAVVGLPVVAALLVLAFFRSSKPTSRTKFTVKPVKKGGYYTAFVEQSVTVSGSSEFWLHACQRRSDASADWREGAGIPISAPEKAGIYTVSWAFGLRRAPLVVSVLPGRVGSPVLAIVPDYTWQAYNSVGGASFYTQPEASPLSLMRPLGYFPSVHFVRYLLKSILHLSGLRREEIHDPAYHPLEMLEQSCGSLDVIAQSLLDSARTDQSYDLSLYKVIVLYGHDEYWSPWLRETIEATVANGTHLLNLSGNTLWWEVERVGNSLYKKGYWHEVAGKAGELLLGVNFRVAGFPLPRYRWSRYGRRQYRQLVDMGFPAESDQGQAIALCRGFRVLSPEHPLFAGTGLCKGDWFGVASEINRVETDGAPLLEELSELYRFELEDSSAPQMLAESWTEQIGLGVPLDGLHRTASIVIIKYGAAEVISLATVGWVGALIVGDIQVEQITRNALRRLLERQS